MALPSNLSWFFCKASLPSREETAPPNLLLSADLLIVPSKFNLLQREPCWGEAVRSPSQLSAHTLTARSDPRPCFLCGSRRCRQVTASASGYLLAAWDHGQRLLLLLRKLCCLSLERHRHLLWAEDRDKQTPCSSSTRAVWEVGVKKKRPRKAQL